MAVLLVDYSVQMRVAQMELRKVVLSVVQMEIQMAVHSVA